ncbi:MAG: glutamine synthetase, partial [Pseudomonadota bacterium]
MTLPTGTKALRTIVADLNGQARGKRLPAHAAQKLTDDGARMPLSALNVDIAGNDIENSPLVFAAGDADGALRPTGRGFVPAPWLDTPTALLPMWMFHDNGAPFDGDPRQALARVLERYEAKGWTPIVATEIEFCLIDDSKDTPQPAASPRSGKVRIGSDILSSRALDGFDRFFTDLYDGAAAMDLPADAAIAEAGLGQFEVNLLHGPAMKAA